jgi:hypothetical protein
MKFCPDCWLKMPKNLSEEIEFQKSAPAHGGHHLVGEDPSLVGAEGFEPDDGQHHRRDDQLADDGDDQGPVPGANPTTSEFTATTPAL